MPESESRKASRRKYRESAKGKAAQRRRNLKKKYGITVEEYDRILIEQSGGCAICGCQCPLKRRLSVDHCHTTSRIRGLLCSLCNKAIGKFRDSPELLIKAALYLEVDASVV